MPIQNKIKQLAVATGFKPARSTIHEIIRLLVFIIVIIVACYLIYIEHKEIEEIEENEKCIQRNAIMRALVADDMDENTKHEYLQTLKKYLDDTKSSKSKYIIKAIVVAVTCSAIAEFIVSGDHKKPLASISKIVLTTFLTSIIAT